MWENRFSGEPSRGSIRDEIRSTFSQCLLLFREFHRHRTKTKDAVCAYLSDEIESGSLYICLGRLPRLGLVSRREVSACP